MMPTLPGVVLGCSGRAALERGCPEQIDGNQRPPRSVVAEKQGVGGLTRMAKSRVCVDTKITFKDVAGVEERSSYQVSA
jgi:hypothetical protein